MDVKIDINTGFTGYKGKYCIGLYISFYFFLKSKIALTMGIS